MESGMSDLVKRLRDQWPVTDNMLEAVDRIQKLERELAEWRENYGKLGLELAAEKALADCLYEDSLGELCSDAAYVAYRKARGL